MALNVIIETLKLRDTRAPVCECIAGGGSEKCVGALCSLAAYIHMRMVKDYTRMIICLEIIKLCDTMTVFL